MAKVKRGLKAIQERTAKKRKQQDAELLANGFQNASNFADTEDHDEHVNRRETDSWEEEQDYELKPRKLQGYGDEVVERLPIKVNGRIERKLHKKSSNIKDSSEKEEDEEDELSEEKSESPASDAEQDGESDEEPDTEESIIALKEDIADLVEKILEEPEENTAALSRLCRMAGSKNPNTCKFSMLALVPVFKNIIPGYRIRPLTDLEKKEKVSKEVARLRNFEQTLVLNYRRYLDLIKDLSKVPNNEDPLKVSLGALATQAANELASNCSHFNFRDDLITILVRRVCKPNLRADPISSQSIKTLEVLLNDDDEGNISLSVVRILAKTLKVRKYNVDESVLNILLSLEVLQDYDPNTKTEDQVSKPKAKKIHLSKKQKKVRKELKAIEDEMRKAEQSVSAEEREKNQGEILKVILSLYLNILRIDSSALVGSVLEGLVKFGSMANLELLGDFLEVMKDIIRNTEIENPSSFTVRKILLCIVTSFSLVAAHTQMKLHTDLSTFVDALYALLPHVSLDPDLELSHKSLRLADPLNNELIKPSVNVSTKAELLLKALDHVFFRSRSGTKLKALAFTKRLYTCMQNTPEHTTIALLKFLEKLKSRYPELSGLYSTEDRVGNGVFIMEADNPTRSNAESAVLWENNILRNHYCPVVVKGIKSLASHPRN